MDILSELAFGVGSAALVLHLLRRTNRRRAPVRHRIEEAYRPPLPSAAVAAPRRRPAADPAPVGDAGRDEARGPYLLAPPGKGSRPDMTGSMMDAMAGPGLCTPRP